MQFIHFKGRLFLPLGIVAAFFLPAYKNFSGFEFTRLALREANGQSELNMTDAAIMLTPLLMVPVAAVAVLVQAMRSKYIGRGVLALPLLLFGIFVCILVLSDAGGPGAFRNPATFLKMQPGFYLALVCAALLVFTKDAQRKKRRRRSSSSILTASQAAASVS